MKRVTVLLTCAVLLLAAALPGFAQNAENGPPPGIDGYGERDIVLIHGLGGDSDMWDAMIPYLSGTYEVFRFELSGHGASETVKDPTIAKEVERLREFLAENEVPRPTLVGHGMGGMIALTYALDHPADVDRLILMDSAPRQLAGEQVKLDITKQMFEDYDHFVAERYLNMSPDPEVTDRIVDQALRTDSASFISLLMSSFDYDETPRLRGLSVPLLVIGSELMFPEPNERREVLDRIGFGAAPVLTFKRMGKTGHYMMLEQPVYIASVILAFGLPERYFQD